MSEYDLSDLALSAARELDKRRAGARDTTRSEQLAAALVESFAYDDARPALPLESIGLVCTVLEDYAQLKKPASYSELRKTAIDAAEKLRNPDLPHDTIAELIDFCVALYYAAREQQEIHDVPLTHPDLVTLT
jgi:hypothetical protein